jgi:hypothetical protein
MRRLAEHGNGIALIFARTETSIFFPWVWEHASAWLFIKGRLHFHFTDGKRAKANAGAPSMLVAYGAGNAKALASSGIEGKLFLDECPRVSSMNNDPQKPLFRVEPRGGVKPPWTDLQSVGVRDARPAS